MIVKRYDSGEFWATTKIKCNEFYNKVFNIINDEDNIKFMIMLSENGIPAIACIARKVDYLSGERERDFYRNVGWMVKKIMENNGYRAYGSQRRIPHYFTEGLKYKILTGKVYKRVDQERKESQFYWPVAIDSEGKKHWTSDCCKLSEVSNVFKTWEDSYEFNLREMWAEENGDQDRRIYFSKKYLPVEEKSLK